ncbi:MAG TPA: hypothetical protein VNI84_20895 [Pyrinomonadaceae bacterium]|jgi:hypothetical protein|nr:hypothetical protein [Pyrinomonadaceae bacterium]
MLKELTGEKKDKKFRRMLGKDYLQAEEIVSQLKNALNGMNATSPLTLVSLD